MAISFALLLSGLAWICLSTWTFPLLAQLAWKRGARKLAGSSSSKNSCKSLEILIPAHRESEALPLTIQSLRAGLACAGDLSIRIRVALSDWTGSEAEASASGADEILSTGPGKWAALRELVLSSKADWVALVDAGTLWEQELLKKLRPFLEDRSVNAINPRYQPTRAGLLQRLHWALESRLKRWENLAGGPVSFHGATMLFRGPQLRAVFIELGNMEWKNDDVVLPLAMRKNFPEGKSVYLFDAVVDDADTLTVTAESGAKRRRRMMAGNLQWIHALFPQVARENHTAALLASRRIARTGWAWSALLLLASLVAFVRLNAGDAAAALLLAALSSGLLLSRDLGTAFLVSLSSPVAALRGPSSWEGTQWK